MNILHLKYALEVEKTESIIKAAKNLYVGQPNLSKAIKELETVLGFNIFTRNPHGMTPTRRGREFLNHARKIVTQIGEVREIYLSDKIFPQGYQFTSLDHRFLTELFKSRDLVSEFPEPEI